MSSATRASHAYPRAMVPRMGEVEGARGSRIATSVHPRDPLRGFGDLRLGGEGVGRGPDPVEAVHAGLVDHGAHEAFPFAVLAQLRVETEEPPQREVEAPRTAGAPLLEFLADLGDGWADVGA